eukprot:COSAG02_NODE_21047_length_805_cov_0.763456_1_plen_71_part_10
MELVLPSAEQAQQAQPQPQPDRGAGQQAGSDAPSVKRPREEERAPSAQQGSAPAAQPGASSTAGMRTGTPP